MVSAANAEDNVLVKKKLQITDSSGKVLEFTVEVADNDEKQQRGLMDRKSMDENHGMLFLFDKKREVNMWMKDTYIPLDMIFIDDNKILKIVEETVPMSLATIASEKKIKAVVELNAGICKKFGIKENDRVAF